MSCSTGVPACSRWNYGSCCISDYKKSTHTIALIGFIPPASVLYSSISELYYRTRVMSAGDLIIILLAWLIYWRVNLPDLLTRTGTHQIVILL